MCFYVINITLSGFRKSIVNYSIIITSLRDLRPKEGEANASPLVVLHAFYFVSLAHLILNAANSKTVITRVGVYAYKATVKDQVTRVSANDSTRPIVAAGADIV